MSECQSEKINFKHFIVFIFDIVQEIRRAAVRIFQTSIRQILRKCDRWTPLVVTCILVFLHLKLNN